MQQLFIAVSADGPSWVLIAFGVLLIIAAVISFAAEDTFAGVADVLASSS